MNESWDRGKPEAMRNDNELLAIAKAHADYCEGVSCSIQQLIAAVVVMGLILVGCLFAMHLGLS